MTYKYISINLFFFLKRTKNYGHFKIRKTLKMEEILLQNSPTQTRGKEKRVNTIDLLMQ